jgi:hypothetical protein
MAAAVPISSSTGARLCKIAYPRDMINTPPEELHAFRNNSDREASVLLMCESRLFKFFEVAGVPLAGNDSATRDASPELLGRILAIARNDGQRFAALNQ